jgi:hypothetical protein
MIVKDGVGTVVRDAAVGVISQDIKVARVGVN